MDDNIDDAWAFVCSLFGINEKNVRVIVKAERDLGCCLQPMAHWSYIY